MVFHFFDFFFEFLCPFESWSNPRFDKDLNKFETWKWKSKLGSFLVTTKWSFWVGFWNFHVWNPKPLLLFMLDFIRQRLGLGGRYMIFLVWICLDFVDQLECLVYYIRRLCGFFLIFLILFDFLWPFESWSNPRFDQDLNKFKTWKWKSKHGSFLVMTMS